MHTYLDVCVHPSNQQRYSGQPQGNLQKGCLSCLGWLCNLPYDGDSLSGLPACCLYTQHRKNMSLWVKEEIALEIVPCEIPWYPRVLMDYGYDGLDLWIQIQRLITLWVVHGLILATGHLPATLPPSYPCKCALSPGTELPSLIVCAQEWE